MKNTAAYCISPDQSLRNLLGCMNANKMGIVFVTDDEHRLLGVITDGDVRRAIMSGTALSASAESLLQRKTSDTEPLCALVTTGQNELIELFRTRGVTHIPLLNASRQVVDVAVVNDFLSSPQPPIHAVVFAGGHGCRLRPYTEDTPKPMLPVGDRPLLELMIGKLSQAGIRHISVATHYLSETISQHFGDGRAFDVKLDYVREDSPLGTAGALGLLERSDEPLLVMNGDILTDVDFRAMATYHKENAALLTVGVREYDLDVPYGVIEATGGLVTSLREKPTFSVYVNAGIYLLDPAVLSHVARGERLDMTELIQRLLDAGLPVASFPIVEYWLDIGQLADYRQAQEDVKEGRVGLQRNGK